MGITIKEYLENVFNLIFSPIKFFNGEEITVSTRQALGTVVLVSAFTVFGNGIADKSVFEPFFPFTFFFIIIGIAILWFLTGLFIEFIAKIFSNENRLNKILFYTSFAMIPYIFFAPLDVLKKSGEMFYTVGVIAETLLYLWIIVLYAMAIKKAYQISIARAFMMLSLPFISVFFALTWAISFIAKMSYINSI
ncbi:hypothetical protein IKQ26_03935 [bacterium]|nr:hypothetical protein [bacterium]